MLAEKIRSIQSTGKQPAILVIGDLMIDHYIIGIATRLSPEAPVPVVRVNKETTTPGGAANLAQNLVSLGAKVTLAGIIGDDQQGIQLLDILNQEKIDTGAILKDTKRPTIVKTRVLAGTHQLIRIDRETTDHFDALLEDELVNRLAHCILDADIVIFSDYAKGLFSEALTQRLIKLADSAQKKVIVDPKGLNYEKYKGAYLIKPNRKELAEAAKAEKVNTVEELTAAAKSIFTQADISYLVVTLSEEGMAIFDESGLKLLPVKATEVFDVTGAGDTVIAALSYFIASGMNVEEACIVANHAAAIVIRHIGSASTTIPEIIREIEIGNA